MIIFVHNQAEKLCESKAWSRKTLSQGELQEEIVDG